MAPPPPSSPHSHHRPRSRSNSPPTPHTMARGNPNSEGERITAAWKQTTKDLVSSIERQIRALFEADQNRGIEAMMTFNPRLELIKSRKPTSPTSAQALFLESSAVRADFHKYIQSIAAASSKKKAAAAPSPPSASQTRKGILRKTGMKKSEGRHVRFI